MLVKGRAHDLLIKENKRIKGLILSARHHTLSGQSREKLFQLLLARQMIGNRQQAVAISPEPGSVTLLRAQCKMLAANGIGQLFKRLYRFTAAI